MPPIPGSTSVLLDTWGGFLSSTVGQQSKKLSALRASERGSLHLPWPFGKAVEMTYRPERPRQKSRCHGLQKSEHGLGSRWVYGLPDTPLWMASDGSSMPRLMRGNEPFYLNYAAGHGLSSCQPAWSGTDFRLLRPALRGGPNHRFAGVVLNLCGPRCDRNGPTFLWFMAAWPHPPGACAAEGIAGSYAFEPARSPVLLALCTALRSGQKLKMRPCLD